MVELSILIPSREEKYLQRTIDDILTHSEAKTEILVGLDGWDTHITGDSRVWVIKSPPIGQRAMTNTLAEYSNARYLLKIDAHCTFSQGFDRILLESADDKSIIAPYLLKLDEETWQPIPKPASSQYCFDTNLIFQYHREAENDKLITPTMCLQGSAWLISRKNYWDWDICDEKLGSWGSQGVELGVKAYLNKGRCLTNKKCYYAHLFREKEEDFPYKRDKSAILQTTNAVREQFIGKVGGLVKKFGYPADWTPQKVKELCKK